MFLTKMFPELLSRTIWANMPRHAADAVQRVIDFEVEVGHPLPDNCFHKLVAKSAIRKAHQTFRAKAFA